MLGGRDRHQCTDLISELLKLRIVVGVCVMSRNEISRHCEWSTIAEEQPKSSLGAVQILNSTHGNSFNQLGPVRRAFKAALRWQWNRSTRPLDCGW